MQSPQQAPLSCLLPAMPFHLSVPKPKRSTQLEICQIFQPMQTANPYVKTRQRSRRGFRFVQIRVFCHSQVMSILRNIKVISKLLAYANPSIFLLLQFQKNQKWLVQLLTHTPRKQTKLSHMPTIPSAKCITEFDAKIKLFLHLLIQKSSL